jgi:hypothetical protein
MVISSNGAPDSTAFQPSTMPDPNPPNNAEWKKFTRLLVHVLYFILALMLFVAALPYLGYVSSPGTIFLLPYGILIATFLAIIEIIYFCRLKKPRKIPCFVKRYLGFLTCVVGRGLFYQLVALHYMMMDQFHRWWNNIQVLSIFLGWVVWLVGLCLTGFAILAKAYNFGDWIEDEEDEGELVLESDNEGDMNIGVLHDQLV